MSDSIRATITVSYEHQVHFTHGAFRADNPLLADVLASRPSSRIPRVLVALDENIAAAQPALVLQQTANTSPRAKRSSISWLIRC